MTDVVVLIGAGQIGQAIARRVGVAKHITPLVRDELTGPRGAGYRRTSG
ncbi:MAG TPA: hypothetical protein VMC86_09040 [Gemmatimonadales bacterium]|nr:hypothetical protein [Gemmatimonadales bacterium]